MTPPSSAWAAPAALAAQMAPARGVDWTTFPWGAVLSATGVLTTVLLLALVTYLSRYFTPVKETQRIEEEMTERFADLKRAVEKSSDRQESRYATVDQLNGLADRMDTKIAGNTKVIDELKDRVAETTTEARSAFALAQQTGGDVRHLSQRLEDVINKGMDRLEKQVEQLMGEIRDTTKHHK